MTVRVAFIAAALVLSLGAATSPVFAQQGYAAPAGIAWTDRAADAVSTAAQRSHVDSSAKMGNAEQNARSVPNYGGTSGGPAY